MHRHTNTRTVCLVLFILMVSLPLSAFADYQILWRSHEDGKSIAREQNKKIFISFYADWCTFCHRMDQKTFKDADIIAYLNAYFINIKVDVDRERSVANNYGIKPIPDFWFLSENGDVIGNRSGYLSPRELLPMLQFIHTESYQKMSYREFRESL